MATVDRQRRALEANPQTYDVVVHMVLEDQLDVVELEDLAVAMSEAIENHTGEEVAGVSVTGTYAPSKIDVGLDIAARSMSELHGILATVLGVVERECPVQFLTPDTHVERIERDDERELVGC